MKKLTPLVVGLASLLMALVPAVASAAEEAERDVLLGSLPGLEAPRGVAFDQANGAVVVADGAGQALPGQVKFFRPGGLAPVFVFNGSEGEAKTPQGGLFYSRSFAVGLAVDASGALYLSDGEQHVVDKFVPNGPSAAEGYKYVCQFSGPGRGCMFDPELELPEPGPTFGRVAGLTIDSSGTLFVADPDNDQVDEFNTTTGADVGQITTVAHPTITSPPVAVATDPAGDVFVLDEQHEVVELRHGGSGDVLLPTEAPDVSGISFDSDAGLLLLGETGRVRAWDPSTPGFSTALQFEAVVAAPEEQKGGIAIQEAPGAPTGGVYVLREEGAVNEYGPPPLLPPLVHGEAVSAVTETSAQLSASVEPRLHATHYEFQFGGDQSYSDGVLPPAPGGLVPGSQESALTSVSLAGLQAGATYHYRIVATNKAGTTFGPDQTFTTFAAEAGGLPDGRAFEMVSPLNKNGGGIEAASEQAVQASPDGERVTYDSTASFGAPHGNPLLFNQYLAGRGGTGWSTQDITPPFVSGSYLLGNPFQAFSSDLSHGLLRNGSGRPLPIPTPPLPGTGAPAGFDNFYVRDNEDPDEDTAFQALLTNTPTILPDTEFYMGVEGITPDLRHIVATQNSTASNHKLALDEWSGGALVPVDVTAEGQTVTGAVLGSGKEFGTEDGTHAISADGSRVFWSVGGDADGGSGSEPVFVREGIGGVDPQTVTLPPGEFLDANPSGSEVLLTTGEVYDDDAGAEHRVADLTEGAGGFVGELGASEDLSRIYFVDTAVLPGAGANSKGQTPKASKSCHTRPEARAFEPREGECEDNVYLYREGAPPRYIATLVAPTVQSLNDQSDWTPELAAQSSRVTPDGETVVFQSQASLTGYDNRDAVTGVPDDEVFVYHAATGALVCVSCNPTGERPVGSATVPAGNIAEHEAYVIRSYYRPRVLSGDGDRVFFESPEALVAQDTDDAGDVYEFEDGHARLISSGTGSGASFFDASENGDDVFFTTANQLVPGDTDQLVDLYDAREPHVPGEHVGPQPEAAVAACSGSACQGALASAPLFASPSSLTASGIGNFPAPLLVAPVKPKTAAQLRAERLAKALRACRKKPKRARGGCERAARRRYAPVRAANANGRAR